MGVGIESVSVSDAVVCRPSCVTCDRASSLTRGDCFNLPLP